MAHKVYRFALYGLSSSGKTCLMAALAMPRHPNPMGYNSTWRPLDASEAKRDDLRYSQDWLKKATDSILKYEVPEPNPTGEEHFTFEYDFTGSDNQTFRIELVDYSGELVNPNVSESELAESLRKKISEMDGILVLGEAPYRDQLGHVAGSQKMRDAQSHKDLYDLRQTFNLLGRDKQDGVSLHTPVALLLNKWDRYSDIDLTNPEKEQDKLADFFTSHPNSPHKGLQDELQHSVTQENFKTFPVSALGASTFVRLDNGDIVERPITVQPLNSSGLENPFIWLAQRRDEIDVQHYLKEAQKNLTQCQKEGQVLLNRFPKNAPPVRQIKEMMDGCRKRLFLQWGGAIAAILLILLTMETGIDLYKYQKLMTGIDNPNVTYADIGKAERWLTRYIIAPQFRHLISKRFISVAKAKETLTVLQKKGEQALWLPVENALYLQSSVEPAEKYLQYYPNAEHAIKCKNILQRAQLEKWQHENEDIFRKLSANVQKHWNNNRILDKELADLRTLPLHPNAESEPMRQARVALENDILKRLREIASTQEWNRFKTGYDDKMRHKNFLAAAQALQSRESDEKLDKLKAEFKRIVVYGIKEEIERAFKDDRLREAEEILDQYALFPLELQQIPGSAEYDVIKLLRQQIVIRQDQNLYEDVLKYMDREHLVHYLQNAPLQTMKTEVSAYKTYLDNSEVGKTLTNLRLSVFITWSKGSEGDDNVIRVSLGGKNVITLSDVKSRFNQTTNVGESEPFSAKPSDRQIVEISVIEEDFLGDDDNGSGSLNKPVSVLAKGSKILLKFEEVTKAVAFVQIKGYPIAPDLPAWHDDI